MSKRSSVESPNHQSSSTPIKPALQAVLGSLDVNLEAELTKYRRHRRRRRTVGVPISSYLQANSHK